MRSDDKRSTSSVHPNAFASSFLSRFDEENEPPTAAEADVAGPWHLEPVPGRGFGVFRAGESLARGFEPAAVFADRWLALLAAAVLPATGRDPMLRLRHEPEPDGSYAVTLDDGEVVGSFQLFDEPLLDGMNNGIGVARSPESLAYLMEAAGKVGLERSGAILDGRMGEGAGGKFGARPQK